MNLFLPKSFLSHRDYAAMRENVTLRNDAIIAAKNAAFESEQRCAPLFITSWESKSILYHSDIRLHLPKLHRISWLDVFSHAFYFG